MMEMTQKAGEAVKVLAAAIMAHTAKVLSIEVCSGRLMERIRELNQAGNTVCVLHDGPRKFGCIVQVSEHLNFVGQLDHIPEGVDVVAIDESFGGYDQELLDELSGKTEHVIFG